MRKGSNVIFILALETANQYTIKLSSNYNLHTNKRKTSSITTNVLCCEQFDLQIVHISTMSSLSELSSFQKYAASRKLILLFSWWNKKDSC